MTLVCSWFCALHVTAAATASLRSNETIAIAATAAGLRSLDLHSNKLTRIDGLATLHSLRELILDHNLIKALEPTTFSSIPRLRRLNLSHNGLRSLAHLSSLTRLQYLHAASNRITDVAELDHLTSLVSLAEVWLVDNTVTKKQWYRALLLSKCPQAKVCTCLTAPIATAAQQVPSSQGMHLHDSLHCPCCSANALKPRYAFAWQP